MVRNSDVISLLGSDNAFRFVSAATFLQDALISEGVGQPTQAAELARLRCRYAQGYLFSKPIPALEVDAQWLSPGQRRSSHLGQRLKPK